MAYLKPIKNGLALKINQTDNIIDIVAEFSEDDHVILAFFENGALEMAYITPDDEKRLAPYLQFQDSGLKDQKSSFVKVVF